MEAIILAQITIKTLHYFVSVTFLVFALWLTFRSVRGIVSGKGYLKLDKFLAYAFIVNLYLQLIFGFILFTDIGTPDGYDYLGPEGLAKRLWPVEHIVLMLFALFIANLGLISSQKSKSSKIKHRKVLIFYLISVAIIAYSLLSIYVL